MGIARIKIRKMRNDVVTIKIRRIPNLKKTKKDDSLEKNKEKITKRRTAKNEEDEEPPMDERKRNRLKRLGTRKQTVKISLGTICKSNDVKERIIEDAKIVSKMRIEVSYVHYLRRSP